MTRQPARGPKPDPARRPAPGVADLRGRLLSGYGSPEGVVAAGLGTLYQNTDPTSDGKVYRKTTASGNTGWVELGGGGGGGGGSTTIAMVGQDDSISGGDLVQNPASLYEFWLPLDDHSLVTFPDSEELLDAGWTFSDHLGSGRETLITPPDAGVYALGANVQVQFDAAPTTDDLELQGGPSIIRPGGGGTEYQFTDTVYPQLAQYNRFQLYTFNSHGLAPTIGDGVDELGFGWSVYFSNGSLPGPPSYVREAGYHARLWAWKIR